ncbi:MAG: hypothetical protein MJA83_16905, partial [Gammaproteobacteria bacterium]|nr:hypothetical protein [Gammaproteobacteria bacterium]
MFGGSQPPGLYFPGAQDPGFSPRPQDVEQEAQVQRGQRMSAAQRLVHEEHQRQQQRIVEQRFNEWWEHSARVLGGGGIVGFEEQVDRGISRGEEHFGPAYREALMDAVHTQVAQDVKDWSDTYNVDPAVFEQVATLGGLPVVRIPRETLDAAEIGRNGPFRQYRFGDSDELGAV